MSTETPTPAPGRRSRKKAEKKSLWQMDLGSLGKKKDADADDDRIEHEPFVPTLPQVNLLPPSVVDSIASSHVRRRLVGVMVLILLVVGGVWWLQGSRISQAEESLAQAQAENAALNQQVQALTPVRQMYEQITRLKEIVTGTLASQPEASVVIQQLAAAGAQTGGKPIAFTSVNVGYTGIPTPGGALNTCPNPDPFTTPATIGCLTFTATAKDRAQVSALLRNLEADPLFVGPYVTSTTATQVSGTTGKSGTEVAFSGSAGVSLDALKTKLTQEQIDALTAPPAPAASASPSAGTS